MCIFNPDQILTQRGGTVGNETAKTLLQFRSVQSLGLSIGLGMMTRREADVVGQWWCLQRKEEL